MKNFNEHTEHYVINGANAKVVALFNVDKIYIIHEGVKYRRPLEDYTNFTGDMKAFAQHIIDGNSYDNHSD
jgi:predicted SPOUT superfamily RNA methylase MTH1